jgi:hypothetical protein
MAWRLLQKLKATQLVKKLSYFFYTLSFILMFKKLPLSFTDREILPNKPTTPKTMEWAANIFQNQVATLPPRLTDKLRTLYTLLWSEVTAYDLSDYLSTFFTGGSRVLKNYLKYSFTHEARIA